MSPYSIPCPRARQERADNVRTRANALTVVDHLHVVAGTGLADPIAAGLAVDLSRGGLENLLDVRPRGGRTTGHERGTVTGTLLTTRDTRADEKETLGLELLGAADRVRKMGVASVNDDIALLEMRLELSNEIIYGLTGLAEQNNFPRSLELSYELFNGECANDFCP